MALISPSSLRAGPPQMPHWMRPVGKCCARRPVRPRLLDRGAGAQARLPRGTERVRDLLSETPRLKVILVPERGESKERSRFSNAPPECSRSLTIDWLLALRSGLQLALVRSPDVVRVR